MEESSRPALKSGAACFQRSEETSSLPGERAVTSFPSDPFYPAFRVPMQAPARCATVRVDWKCTSRCDAQFILSRDVSRTVWHFLSPQPLPQRMRSSATTYNKKVGRIMFSVRQPQFRLFRPGLIAELWHYGLVHYSPSRGAVTAEFGAQTVNRRPFSIKRRERPEIARGKFAVVKKCRRKSSGQEYAAKFIRKRKKGKDCRETILHEIRILEMSAEHCRLIDLFEVFETHNEMILVLEYAAGGEIFDHCVTEEDVIVVIYMFVVYPQCCGRAAGGEIFDHCVTEEDDCFNEKDVVRLMRQILEGVSYLHERNIIHLDLKPQNILLTKPAPAGDIKLVDFGLARRVNVHEEIREIVGTPDYVAPEVLSFEPLSTATDMWSIGVLAYVMLTGHSPFLGDSKQETFLHISTLAYDFPEELFLDVSADAQDFIKSLLVKEPEDRATAKECLLHPWLCAASKSPAIDFSVAPAEPQPSQSRDSLPHDPSQPQDALRSPFLGQRRPLDCNKENCKDDAAVPKRFKFDDSFVSIQEIKRELVY
ncbi:Serine/threonine-protein kinase 17A [Branchiostoma belcheri]|nr:Serine/threonine-protein kinase 17A [Branchiostoma belcheri]